MNNEHIVFPDAIEATVKITTGQNLKDVLIMKMVKSNDLAKTLSECQEILDRFMIYVDSNKNVPVSSPNYNSKGIIVKL